MPKCNLLPKFISTKPQVNNIIFILLDNYYSRLNILLAGFFSCHSCRTNGSWNVLEKFLTQKGNENHLKHLLKYAFTKESNEYKNIISNTKLLSKYSEEVVLLVCSKFGLPVSKNVKCRNSLFLDIFFTYRSCQLLY